MDTTIIIDEPQISVAPANADSVNWARRIRANDVDAFWMNTIGKKQLEDNETIRITTPFPHIDEKGVKQSKQLTLNVPVRNSEDLKKVMEDHYKSIREMEWKKEIGFSISSAVFSYNTIDKETGLPLAKIPAPGLKTFKYIKHMVIDLDSHADKSSKGRFNFNVYDDNSRRIIALQVLNSINDTLVAAKCPIILQPTHIYCTGGGLQFILQFDKEMYKEEALKIFSYIGETLTKDTKRLEVFGTDALGNYQVCYLEFDESCKDITHTQRLGGTVNPKEIYYGHFAEELLDVFNEDRFDAANAHLRSIINNHIAMSDKEKTEHKMNITRVSNEYKEYYNKSAEIINAQDLLNIAVMVAKSDEVFKSGDTDLFKHPMDLEIIKQISLNDQIAYMGRGLSGMADKGSYVEFKCPFDDDNNSSFAIYKNEGKVAAIAVDQHDKKTYNIIQYMMADKGQLEGDIHRGMSRGDAIQRLAVEFSLTLNRTERKQFNNDQTNTAVAEYITKIDTENFVYYRLANKNRACIIREFENGEAFTFDGTHMMSDHILMNQLGMHRADNELRMAFHDQFVEKVLENAFEEFSPGKPFTYERKFIKYINLWIPGKDYKKVHELAESLVDMDLVSALSHIKERLPAMWHYINQITQKGSLEYFTNWLAAIAKFEVMSSIPVVTSVQGTGKNLFIDEVFSFYLNREYVNVVNGDKIANNFNSFLGTSSLVVLDEGDFSNTKELNNLKLLSGNKFIQVEKKGVDSSQVQRHFNMIMFTNGETPLHHPSNDRRVSYFRLDVTLEDSVKHAGYEFIDDFIDAIKSEVTEFWAVLVKTKTRKEWVNMNIKDNQFNKQILLMHPFGKLVIKLVENDWEYIRLQMNENVQDPMVITSNLEMLATIKKTFDEQGYIDLTLVNRYIHSLNFKSYVGVQQFIDNNALHRSGISKVTTTTSVKIVIDKYKVANLIHMNNNLGNLYDAYSPERINETLQKEVITIEDVLDARAVTEQIDRLEMALVANPNTDPLGVARPVDPSTIIQ